MCGLYSCLSPSLYLKQAKILYGANNDVSLLWSQFAATGSFESFTEGYFVNGAAAGMVTLGPYETKEVTIVLGWYFPNRDFIGLRVGKGSVLVRVVREGEDCEGRCDG